ncbi:MAG: tyrosine-protein phosphatase [Candidatus Lokiarchaeota archaeon]|nr:tyrosine-protein phosphatase [Candidatus Lokiarchaeota archaeon]
MYKAKEALVTRLASWGKGASFIEGMYHVASTTSGLAGPGTELEFLLVMDPGRDVNAVLDAFKVLFSEELLIALLVPSEIGCNLISLHLKGLPRVTIHIATPRDRIVGDLMQARTTATIVERVTQGSTAPIARVDEGASNKKAAIAAFVNKRVSSILHKFEIVAVAHHQSDYLGYYAIYYPLLVDTIHLQGILEGKAIANGSMKHLLNAVMAEMEHQYFTRHLLNAGFGEANTARRHFMDWFLSLVEDIAAKFGTESLPAPVEYITRFCEYIHDFYYLRNFRPVQGTDKVFRSLAPAAFEGDPRLEKWFVDNNIKTLIDLRRPDEVERSPDDAVLAKKLGQAIHLLNFNADEVSASDYTKGLIGCKDNVRLMFEAMLDSPGNTLIHCGAGKDRTGMISALIELLLGIPEEKIVAAYLLSGQDTREERIVQTLRYIKEHGGVSAYLSSCGFPEGKQGQLTEKLGAS